MVHMVMFKLVRMQLHIGVGANKPIEAVLKTFNVGAVAKNRTVRTVIFVGFRQIARGKIEAVLQVKIVTYRHPSQGRSRLAGEGQDRIPG